MGGGGPAKQDGDRQDQPRNRVAQNAR
jgi:hypothetical protein